MRKSILLYLSNTFYLSVWHRSSIQLPMRRPHLYINRFPFPHCTRTTHGWTEIIPRWRDRSVAHCALTLRRSAHATGEYKLMYYIYTYTLYMYVYRQSCVPLEQRQRERDSKSLRTGHAQHGIHCDKTLEDSSWLFDVSHKAKKPMGLQYYVLYRINYE